MPEEYIWLVASKDLPGGGGNSFNRGDCIFGSKEYEQSLYDWEYDSQTHIEMDDLDLPLWDEGYSNNEWLVLPLSENLSVSRCSECDAIVYSVDYLCIACRKLLSTSSALL
jgi:hypothetical protein